MRQDKFPGLCRKAGLKLSPIHFGSPTNLWALFLNWIQFSTGPIELPVYLYKVDQGNRWLIITPCRGKSWVSVVGQANLNSYLPREPSSLWCCCLSWCSLLLSSSGEVPVFYSSAYEELRTHAVIGTRPEAWPKWEEGALGTPKSLSLIHGVFAQRRWSCLLPCHISEYSCYCCGNTYS